MIGSEVINMVMTLEQCRHEIQREWRLCSMTEKGVVSKFGFAESYAWCSEAQPPHKPTLVLLMFTKATRAQSRKKELEVPIHRTRRQLPPKHSRETESYVWDISQLDIIITSSVRFPNHGKIKGNVVILENDPLLQKGEIPRVSVTINSLTIRPVSLLVHLLKAGSNPDFWFCWVR